MQRIAVITGAGSGIGYEFSRQLLQARWSVVLIDRDSEQLHKVKREFQSSFVHEVELIVQDLSNQDAAQIIFNQLKGRGVNMLINNAGFGLVGDFIHTDWEREKGMINLQIHTLTHLSKLFGQEMSERKSGYILNMASIAAFYPGPYMSIYYATKAYILSFTRALAFELRSSGVKVTALCPGPVKTNFQKSAGSKQQLVSSISLLNSPQKVASYGLKSLFRGKVVAIPGILNKLMVFLERFFPMRVITYIIGKLQARNQGK